MEIDKGLIKEILLQETARKLQKFVTNFVSWCCKLHVCCIQRAVVFYIGIFSMEEFMDICFLQGKRSQVFFHTWGKLDGQFCFYYRNLLCQFIHALKNFWWLLFLHWNGDKKRERENGYEIKQCFKISQLTKNEDFNPAFEVSFSAFGNSFVVWLQYS